MRTNPVSPPFLLNAPILLLCDVFDGFNISWKYNKCSL
jgi:hypothetical protein